MTKNEIIFCVILVINFLLAVGYLLFQRLKDKEGEADEERRAQSYWTCFFVMVLCPVAGIFFFGISYLIYKIFFYKPVDLADVIFSKERIRGVVKAREEQERDIVSLEEAIEITNEKDLRSLMMNIVRGDIRQYLASISLALNSGDSETAHYAASVLQDALNDFRIQVEKQKRLAFEKSSNQPAYLDMLMDYMSQVLEQKVFQDMEQKDYVHMMNQVCEKMYLKYPDRIKSSQIESVTLLLMDIEEYEECEKWCERAKDLYPNALSTYTCQLKLYFTWRKREAFFTVVEELKKSSVVVDNETLELIRVFR